MLASLLGGLLGERAQRVVTADELRAIDVDPTPPSLAEYV
jgi:hypothetical protein